MSKTIKLTLFALILIFALILTGCFGNEEEETNYNGEEETGITRSQEIALLEGFERFETEYFEIQYNSDWTTNTISLMGIDSATFTAPNSETSVSVTMDELPARFNFTQYIDLRIAEVRQTYGEAISEVEEEVITVNGREAYVLRYEHNELGEFIQTLVAGEGKVFIITLIIGDYEDAESVYQEMVSTFLIR